jgi:hypothetical protein
LLIFARVRYTGPHVQRDWDKIALRRALLRNAKSTEDRAELRKKFRIEDAMAGDAMATADPLFMPRTKSAKQNRVVVQPTDAFGLAAIVGGGNGENLPTQLHDADAGKVKSASHAKKLQKEQEERRQRLQLEQEKLLREQAIEIPTVLSNAPPPNRLTDARALFRAIKARKIPILSGAEVDERVNGFGLALDSNWPPAQEKSLRDVKQSDEASEASHEERALLAVGEDSDVKDADAASSSSASSSSSSMSKASFVVVVALVDRPSEQAAECA